MSAFDEQSDAMKLLRKHQEERIGIAERQQALAIHNLQSWMSKSQGVLLELLEICKQDNDDSDKVTEIQTKVHNLLNWGLNG
jgi:hypothetical protein